MIPPFYENCWLLAFWLTVLVSNTLVMRRAVSAATTTENQQHLVQAQDLVSLVLEPFEPNYDSAAVSNPLGDLRFINHDYDAVTNTSTTNSNLEAFLSNEAYVGNQSLLLPFKLDGTSGDASYYAVERTLSGRNLAFNGRGATHLSFAHRVNNNKKNGDAASSVEPIDLAFRVLLYDDDIGCANGVDCRSLTKKDFEVWQYSDPSRTLSFKDEKAAWSEIRISLDTELVEWTRLTDTIGNGQLDLDRIKAWRIEFFSTSDVEGSLQLDHLRLVGDGHLFGAALAATSFEAAVSNGQFTTRYQLSTISEEETQETIELTTDGSVASLTVDYVIEQMRTWGSTIGYTHLVPSRAYYNLSQSTTAVAFDYRILSSADPSGRTHIRWNLADVSHCQQGCRNSEAEQHYSYHHVLDEASSAASDTMSIVADFGSFILPGNSGELGNEVLDKETIKGFSLLFSMDGKGDIGSIIRGSVELKNFTAVGEWIKPTQQCTVESGIAIRTSDKYASTILQHLKQRSPDECCEACQDDPDCMYGMTTEWRACFLFSELLPGQTYLRNDAKNRPLPVFYKENARGTFCEKCDCDPEQRSIDCRGKDLRILPRWSLGGEDESPAGQRNLLGWNPQSLDLRNNPRLTVLLSDAFAGLESSLEELSLPGNLVFIPKESVENLTLLRTVAAESENATTSSDASSTQLINVISNPGDAFPDICCGLGHRISVSPTTQWHLCNLVIDKPGVDAVYEPFIRYHSPRRVIQVITDRSDFMFEAAESVEKCAGFCHVQKDCRYFVHDSRKANAENRCFHYGDQGEREERCCESYDYADENQTIPAYTSGWVPATRSEEHNARVVVEAESLDPEDVVLRAGPENDFRVRFTVSLGATPLRGAVWITPALASTFVSGVDVQFSPSRVVLYDDKTVAPVEVRVTNPNELESGGSFVVTNSIESCDAAFQASSTCSVGDETAVQINLSLNSPSEDMNQLDKFRPAGFLVFALLFVLSWGFVLWVVTHWKRRIVKSSQPVFLIFLCVGTMIVATTIIPLSLDDSVLHSEGGCVGCECSKCDHACMAAPWLFFSGFTLIFASLFSKIWRLNRLIDSAKHFRHVIITATDVMVPLFVLLGLNFIMLVTWTAADGMYYDRSKRCGSDEFTSYGSCKLGHNGVSIAMACALVCTNLAALILANFQAYKARKVATEFNESKWIGIAMICIFQIMIIGLPLMFLVQDTPAAVYFVQLGIVSVVVLAVLLLIFIPKMVLLNQSLRDSKRNVKTRNNAANIVSILTTVSDSRSHDHNSQPSTSSKNVNRSVPATITGSTAWFSNQTSMSDGRTISGLTNVPHTLAPKIDEDKALSDDDEMLSSFHHSNDASFESGDDASFGDGDHHIQSSEWKDELSRDHMDSEPGGETCSGEAGPSVVAGASGGLEQALQPDNSELDEGGASGDHDTEPTTSYDSSSPQHSQLDSPLGSTESGAEPSSSTPN